MVHHPPLPPFVREPSISLVAALFDPQLDLVLMASPWLVSPMNSCDIRQTKAPDYFGPFAVFEQARLMVALILLNRAWLLSTIQE